MTKPSDFTPERVLEMQQPLPPESANPERRAWIYRAIGGTLMIGVWLLVVVRHSIGDADFAIGTAALLGIATYSFIFSARSRKLAVQAEKRLRLGLLVHNMELANMAMQDDLTQLFNRRYFFERLERELETANAFKRPLSVILLDLDEMKAVNDNYGHRVGDKLLRNFGKFLLEHTRGSDVPARVGGDEFAIILPDTPIVEAKKLQERLADKLAKLDIIDSDDATFRVHASLGYAGFPETASSVDELIQQADAAMYAAKHDHKGIGRSSIREGEPTPVPPVFRRLESEAS
ncbi:MAG TPA: GGDEF domain-containing protein [Dehalococcoidia bacterium]|nr:GGDEF domain-containing protein [Dehalococcoidia bacterium]